MIAKVEVKHVFAEDQRVAVVGATGAVGREALAILAERGFDKARVLALSSESSAGEVLRYGPDEVVASTFDPAALGAGDVVVLATSASHARSTAPTLVERGCRVVDNSSAFRLDPDVPLVVPEVNGHLAHGANLVANPNCSTILMVVALEPLRRAFGIERTVISTYQAVSGAGRAAMNELEVATRAALDGIDHVPKVFPETCAFNVFPHESELDPETGSNEEELKLVRETRRLWEDGRARIVATCARVPVLRSHCQSILVTFERSAARQEVRTALAQAPGLELVDQLAQRDFPSSLRAQGGDSVLVGRVRPASDEKIDAQGRTRSYCLWVAGDQLRKGAALNALQIASQSMP